MVITRFLRCRGGPLDGPDHDFSLRGQPGSGQVRFQNPDGLIHGPRDSRTSGIKASPVLNRSLIFPWPKASPLQDFFGFDPLFQEALDMPWMASVPSRRRLHLPEFCVPDIVGIPFGGLSHDRLRDGRKAPLRGQTAFFLHFSPIRTSLSKTARRVESAMSGLFVSRAML